MLERDRRGRVFSQTCASFPQVALFRKIWQNGACKLLKKRGIRSG